MKMSNLILGRTEEVLDAARAALRPWMAGSAVLNDSQATLVGLHLKPLPGSVVEIRRRYRTLVEVFQTKFRGQPDVVVIAADDSDPVDAMRSIYVRLPPQDA